MVNKKVYVVVYNSKDIDKVYDNGLIITGMFLYNVMIGISIQKIILKEPFILTV